MYLITLSIIKININHLNYSKMSRSRKRGGGLTNPFKKIVNYKGNSGVFSIYDKESKTSKEVDSLEIILLDCDRVSVTGYSPDYEAGYISNMVFNTKKEKLKVGVISNGKFKTLQEGFYQDIKSDLDGLQYTRNVICLIKDGDELVMANLELTGAARTKFADWYKENSDTAYDGVITLSPLKDELLSYNKKQKGYVVVPKAKQAKWQTTWLYMIGIGIEDADEDTINIAVEEDTKLQDYFSELSGEGKNTDTAPSAPEDEDAGKKKQLPF